MESLRGEKSFSHAQIGILWGPFYTGVPWGLVTCLYEVKLTRSFSFGWNYSGWVNCSVGDTFTYLSKTTFAFLTTVSHTATVFWDMGIVWVIHLLFCEPIKQLIPRSLWHSPKILKNLIMAKGVIRSCRSSHQTTIQTYSPDYFLFVSLRFKVAFFHLDCYTCARTAWR